MIQDEELRSLYQDTSEQRLNNLQTGLLQLEQEPDNPIALEDLRREFHSLKGDSRVMGLETVAALAQELEEVVKILQQEEAKFTTDINDCFYQGIYAMGQLVEEAVTDEPSGVDYVQILEFLKAVVATAAVSPVVAAETYSADKPQTFYIEDDELREIYRITSQSRLQTLETNLKQLELSPNDAAVVEILRRETHSLKGDSRAVELDAIADLVQSIEDLIHHIQDQAVPFTAQTGQHLQDGLTAISKLVGEATTGDPSNVVLDHVLEQLAEITPVAASSPVATTETIAVPSSSLIDDAELRQIYQSTTEERLQTLESNLLYLEKNPNDKAALSTLLRESHSLKGDSRSAGVESVEALTHAFEDVLGSIQKQTLSPDAMVIDQLYEGLDAISNLVYESVTGELANVDTSELVSKLTEIVPEVPVLVSEPEPSPISSPPAADAPAVTQADTIRVQVRDLDVLTTQAEELAVTRIQISQTATQTEQLMTLWEEWQANKGKQKPAAGQAYEERFEQLISTLRSTIQANSSKLEIVSEDLRNRVRRLQLLPLSSLFQPLRRVVRDLAKQQSKEINLILEGENASADKHILEGIKDSLMHIVRNAVDHGIEPSIEREAVGKSAMATLQIKAYQTAISLMIEIKDDGRGLDVEKIKQTAIKRRLHSREELEAMSVDQIHRLILAPGFSTRSFITEISGRGVGLDVVRDQVEKLKGSIQIESTPGTGSTFQLQLSTALSTANVVLVETQGITFALPIEFLKTTLIVSSKQIETVDGQDTILLEDQTIPVANLSDVLELSKSPIYDWVAQTSLSPEGNRPCVVLNVGNEQAGFFIDRLISQQEIVSKPMGSLLKRVRNVSGTTVLGSGEICMILNPPDMLKSVQQLSSEISTTTAELANQDKPVILLVEDSPPVRIQEKRLFEAAGYDVVTATNGLEGYNTLQNGLFDAVVSDVEMPYLDGFSLVAKIRQHEEYDDLPIVLVTTLDSAADRQRGADAGANAYILKGRFNQEALLETLQRLI